MANVKKYRCMNVGNCQTANENKTFDIADGAEKICPDCKKDMIVEVKGGMGAGMIGGIVGGVVVAGLAVCYGLGVFSGKADAETDKIADTDTVAVVDEVMPDTVAVEVVEEVDTIAAVEEETHAVEEPKPAGGNETGATAASANYLTNYALPYRLYTGPAKNGRPNGPNGDIKVTKDYSLDMHNGQSLQLAKGDKISRCKFVNGQLASGMLERPDGSARNITIGVN